MSYLSDMDNLNMTCSDFVNALKMLICSEKHPVSRANHGYTKKVVIDVLLCNIFPSIIAMSHL